MAEFTEVGTSCRAGKSKRTLEPGLGHNRQSPAFNSQASPLIVPKHGHQIGTKFSKHKPVEDIPG